MTDCPDGLMRDLLPEYAHGVLDGERTARVAAHVATCEACRAELALLAQVRDGLSLGVPRVDVAAIVRALPRAPVLRSMDAGSPGLRVSRQARGRVAGWSPWQFAAAAGLVLAVGSGLLWQREPAVMRTRIADSSDVHVAAESTTSPAAVVGKDGITFGGGLSDLSLDDLQALLGQMDSVRTLPSTDPESMTPVIAMNEGGKAL